MSTEAMERHYVIRFINTRLAGCEYVIREESASFIVANRDTLALYQEQSFDPVATYILDDSINTRFDIVWRSEASLPLLVSHHANGLTEQTIPFHQMTEVDGVCFTLRPERESSAPAMDAMEDCQVNTGETTPASAANPVTTRRAGRMGAMVLLGLLAAGAGYYLMTRQNTQQLNSVSQILGGKPYEYMTFIGRDGMVYVFARDANSRARAWQSLIRHDTEQRIAVLSTSEEENKIARELGSRWPQLKFHAIRFDNPTEPEIILSQERSKALTGPELETISAKMAALFPWSSRFVFSTMSDHSIAESAEQGLRGIVTAYDKRHGPDNVTFSITGALNDSELNALKKHINEFRKKWRGDYIQFDIALLDNPLQGKSRLYGSNGYIKLNPEQWYFPEQR